MDKHELIKTAVTAIIAVIAKELLSWFVTASKKLAHHGQACGPRRFATEERVDSATPAKKNDAAKRIEAS